MSTVEQSPEAPTVTNVINELPEVIRETKAGYKTTEFWLTIATALGGILSGLPEKYSALVTVGSIATYVLSRGIAKKGVPHIEIASV